MLILVVLFAGQAYGQTLYQEAHVSKLLRPLSAAITHGSNIYVEWTMLEQAQFYIVYERSISDKEQDLEWKAAFLTDKSHVDLEGVVCSKSKFGVQAVISGVKSDIVEVEDIVTVPLDNTRPFVAPNLKIDSQENKVVLNWEHRDCISSYVVKACTTYGDQICEERQVSRESKDALGASIQLEIDNLQPCTIYTLTILPVTPGKTLQPDRRQLMTAVPSASPPKNFTAVYNQEKDVVEFDWDEVTCASRYRIKMYSHLEKIVWETNNPKLLNATLYTDPCVTYKFGVVAVVGGVESQPYFADEITVPPSQLAIYQPILEILDYSNDTISLFFKPTPYSSTCTIQVYEIKYTSLEVNHVEQSEIDPETVERDGVILSFPGASGPSLKLAWRFKYEGFDSYSPWKPYTNPSDIFSKSIDSP